MITVGLDFGTHQTKVCVERKESMELEYSFFEFADTEGNKHYTLPSIIGENADGRLAYGYIDAKKYKDIKRYFKQATFNTGVPESSKLDAMRQSVSYTRNILPHAYWQVPTIWWRMYSRMTRMNFLPHLKKI